MGKGNRTNGSRSIIDQTSILFLTDCSAPCSAGLSAILLLFIACMTWQAIVVLIPEPSQYFYDIGVPDLESRRQIVSVLLPCQLIVMIFVSTCIFMMLFKKEIFVWVMGRKTQTAPADTRTIIVCSYAVAVLKVICQLASTVASNYWPSQTGVLGFFSACVTINFGLGHSSSGMPIEIAPALVFFCVVFVANCSASDLQGWEVLTSGFMLFSMIVLSLVLARTNNLQSRKMFRRKKFFQHQLDHLVSILEDLVPRKYIKTLIAGCGGYGHNRIPCSSCRVVALQLDICGFTVLSQTVSPVGLAQKVHELFSDFDKAVIDFKLFKVDTIGDAYIVVGWLHSTEEQQKMDRQARHMLEHKSVSSLSKVVHFREGLNALFLRGNRTRSSNVAPPSHRSGRPATAAQSTLDPANMEQHIKSIIAVVTIQKFVRKWKARRVSSAPHSSALNPASHEAASYSTTAAHKSAGTEIDDQAEARAVSLPQEQQEGHETRKKTLVVDRWALVRSAVVKTPSIRGPPQTKRDAKNAIKFQEDGRRCADVLAVAAVIIKSLAKHRAATGVVLNARIGIATGDAIAGIVGDLQPRFSVQGEAMKLISQLEPAGEKGAVHCSAEFLDSVRAWREGDEALSSWSISEVAPVDSDKANGHLTRRPTYILHLNDTKGIQTADCSGNANSDGEGQHDMLQQDAGASAGDMPSPKKSSMINPFASISSIITSIASIPWGVYRRGSSPSKSSVTPL